MSAMRKFSGSSYSPWFLYQSLPTKKNNGTPSGKESSQDWDGSFYHPDFLGLFSLVSGLFRNSSSNEEATVSFTAEDSNSAAYSEEIQESYIDPLFVPDEYIHDGMMTLPESDIKIGMPEYSDWQTDALISNTEYSCDFKLENGLNMIFYSYVADYPFSKSEEEEYFREAQKYLRLEGTNDQYFYTVENENGIVATIVDRIHGRNYVIEIYSDEESGNPSMKKGTW